MRHFRHGWQLCYGGTKLSEVSREAFSPPSNLALDPITVAVPRTAISPTESAEYRGPLFCQAVTVVPRPRCGHSGSRPSETSTFYSRPIILEISTSYSATTPLTNARSCNTSFSHVGKLTNFLFSNQITLFLFPFNKPTQQDRQTEQ